MFVTAIKTFLYIVLMIDGICSEVSLDEQMEHILRRRLESNGLANKVKSARRGMFSFDQTNTADVIGAPSLPSHLPEAEAILPGHTLLRPALGMLKSSIKFPHIELENGAGVLGNYNNLGIKYDGRNQRVMYTEFRRNSPSQIRRRNNYNDDILFQNTRRVPYDYIMVVPSKKNSKPTFSVTNTVLDLGNKRQSYNQLLKTMKSFKKPVKNRLILYLVGGKSKYFEDLSDEGNTGTSTELMHLNKDIYVADTSTERMPLNKSIYVSNMFTELMPLKKDIYVSGLLRVETNPVKNLPNGRREEDNNEQMEEIVDMDEEISKPVVQNGQEDGGITKREKFYESKNLFNVVQIHQDALNFEELVPELLTKECGNSSITDKNRPWWYYNQVDFKSFEKNE